jgi:hypothetical protein
MKSYLHVFILSFAFCTSDITIHTLGEVRDGGCLVGTWWVKCSQGHIDQVDGITCNHDCSQCNFSNKSVDDGTAMVVCPYGHATRVQDHTSSHLCSFVNSNGIVCNTECKVD